MSRAPASASASVIRTPQALQDRCDVWDHIAADSLHAAIRMDGLFSAAADNLATHPKLGHPGKISGTRELLPHAPYAHFRLVYEIRDDVVWVLALAHTARRWPSDSP
ncbi:type II toxin-antitoxin system RelE/ParE family toxin [Duganella sp. FT3S]|uniref:Type II toxin-antitoxin system RelE/ParE family toxin n=1 Tax=Rugamonas fusca TaxID=2758568 RepID=A0A7W2EHR7_9BURK|nr:type II toxin-antitoxin system RelE/ParE family toxin [Rugamonas fusca]